MFGMSTRILSQKPALGGIAICGRLGRGKSHVAMLLGAAEIAAGRHVAWVWPGTFESFDPELPTEFIQLSAASLADLRTTVEAIDVDLVIVDQAEGFGLDFSGASEVADSLAHELGRRVVVTVAW